VLIAVGEGLSLAVVEVSEVPNEGETVMVQRVVGSVSEIGGVFDGEIRVSHRSQDYEHSGQMIPHFRGVLTIC